VNPRYRSKSGSPTKWASPTRGVGRTRGAASETSLQGGSSAGASTGDPARQRARLDRQHRASGPPMCARAGPAFNQIWDRRRELSVKTFTTQQRHTKVLGSSLCPCPQVHLPPTAVAVYPRGRTAEACLDSLVTGTTPPLADGLHGDEGTFFVLWHVPCTVRRAGPRRGGRLAVPRREEGRPAGRHHSACFSEEPGIDRAPSTGHRPTSPAFTHLPRHQRCGPPEPGNLDKRANSTAGRWERGGR